MHLRSEAFTDEDKARNFAYYEGITVRDSSLSAATQAVLAAEMGHLDLAYDYLGEAALVDLEDLHANTASGLHMAALAGGWSALVSGFGGFRVRDGVLCFAPRLPTAITRLVFHLWYRRRNIRVASTATEVTYTVVDGEPIDIRHHGDAVRLTSEPVSRPVPPVAPWPAPTQPPGRAPASRRRA
jgi:alpha,alpha-trehalose phosphorylase